ncbi:MAG: YfhO family protein [Eubacteriales bacterium]|nr:YfhO family protein [Eubacteriales bacterium]
MKKTEWLKKNWQYVGAFLMPVILMLMHCLIRDSWLLGNGSILRGDAGVQYVYIFYELWNKVHQGDFSFFSWNAACGFDFYLNMLYYAMSPSTIIVLLLPVRFLEDALQCFIVLKWALISLTAVYFFMNTRYNKLSSHKQFVAFSLGLCYALSGFFLKSLFLFNWLDTIALFPILLLLIEKLVWKGSWRLYTLLLAIAILCNFYIAFPICIFLVFWTVLQVLELESGRLKKFVLFIKSSLLGGCMAMVAVIPCVCNVGDRYSVEQNVSEYIKSIRMTFGTFVSRFWSYQTLQEYQMYFSITAGALVLFLFCFFVKSNKKIKIAKLTMMLILITSVIFGAPNFVWHGFSIPHMFEPRFGFLVIFVMLVMVLDGLIYIDTIRYWHCFVVILTWIALFVYAFFDVSEYDDFYVYLIHFMLLALVSSVVLLYVKKSITLKSFVMVTFGICLLELISNAYISLSEYDIVAVGEHEKVKDVVAFDEDIQLAPGERFAFVHGGYNVGMMLTKPCTSGFVSYANGKLCSLMADLGMNVTEDSGFLYLGQSPLTNMMFNVRYGIGTENQDFGDSIQEKEKSSMYLYQIEQLPGLGYMVNDEVQQWKTDYGLPLMAQNEFVNKALGIEQDLFMMFEPKDLTCQTMFGNVENQFDGENGVFAYQYELGFGEDGCIISYQVDKDGDYFASLSINSPASIGIKVEDELTYISSEQYGRCVLHIGKVKKGQNVKLICVPKNEGKGVGIVGQLVQFDDSVWKAVKNVMLQQTMKIDEMKSDYIKGHIVVEKEGMMMTSIPASKGFTVYVDGKKVSYQSIAGALIGVKLKEGNHEIEFVYETPYAKLGMMISLVGVLLFSLSFKVGKRKYA